MKVCLQCTATCNTWAFAALALMLGDIAGYGLRAGSDPLTAFWPSSGILLGLFLLTPPRRWTLLAGVAFTTETLVSVAWSSERGGPDGTILFATLHVFESALIAVWIGRHAERPFLDRARDLARGLAATVVGCTLSGIAAGYILTTLEPAHSWVAGGLSWGLGDTLGVLVMTPLTVLWGRQQVPPRLPDRRCFEAVAGPLTRVVAISRDITRRTHAELALEASEQRFRSFAELVPEILWSTDPTGRFTYVSPSLTTVLGYRPEETIGLDFRTVTSDGKAAAESLLAEATARKSDQRVFEVEHRHRDGTPRWCEVSAVAQRNRDGTVVALHGVTRDISEQRQAREQLRIQKVRLQERTVELTRVNAELDAFAQTVSHDLHAPLRHIKRAAWSIREPGAPETDGSETAELIRGIRTSVDRAITLVDDLLEFSRAERSRLDLSPVDLSALAESVLHELQQTEPPRDVEIRIEPGIVAEADAGLARTAVRNLLANAWKFTADAPRTEIAVSRARATPDRVVLAIRDNGVGFDADRLRDEIFQPFSRFHASNDYAGHGLGLSTVDRITRRLGGRCWAKSAPGQGTTFFLELPCGNPVAHGTSEEGRVPD